MKHLCRVVLAVAVASSLTFTLGGCSIVIMERVGQARADVTPRCSASEIPALLDAIYAAFYGFLAVDEREQRDEALLRGGVAALMVGSVVYGVRARRECTDAREAHDRWLRQQFGPGAGRSLP